MSDSKGPEYSSCILTIPSCPSSPIRGPKPPRCSRSPAGSSATLCIVFRPQTSRNASRTSRSLAAAGRLPMKHDARAGSAASARASSACRARSSRRQTQRRASRATRPRETRPGAAVQARICRQSCFYPLQWFVDVALHFKRNGFWSNTKSKVCDEDYVMANVAMRSAAPGIRLA